MRYYQITLMTNEEQIQEHATIKIRDYCYDSPLGAMNHYMYKNLPTGIGVFGYRQEGELTRAVFCFDENSFSFREALSCVTDMLQQVFSAGRIKGEVEEITMYQTLEKYREGKRKDYVVPSRMVDAIKLWIYYEYERDALNLRFDFQERIVPKQRRKAFMQDPSLARELSRIEAHRNDSGLRGNAVHYVIAGRSPEAAADMTEVLMQRLLEAGHIRSRRMEVISQMDPELYRSNYLERIIENNEGGTVVIDLKEKFGCDPVQYATAVRYLEKLLKQYRNHCLFVFTYDMENQGFAFQLLPQLNKYVNTVMLREGKGDRKEAVRYLQELIKNSDYAPYARQAGEFMKQFPGNEFTQTDVLMAHEQFEAWCLGKNVLGASDTNPARDFMMDRDEAPESACDRLQKLIGLDIVKKQIDRIVASDLLEQARKKQKGRAYQAGAMHMIFAGNPGTAKTTVARLFAGIAKEKGILKSGAFVERSGTDGSETIRDAFVAAKGGVLFIDEAYELNPRAITALIQEMENKRSEVIVVLAGYNDGMKGFLKANEGLKSRIPHWVEFPDYSAEELTEIFKYEIRERGLTVTEGAVQKARHIFERVRYVDDFGNGRYVRNLVDRAVQNQGVRLTADGGKAEEIPAKKLFCLEEEDITPLDEGLVKERPAGTARKELEAMIGLVSAKDIIRKALAHFKTSKICVDRGISQEKPSFHMVFTGNPGTAKTTVARLLAEILRDEKVLPTGNFVEVGRADLVGPFTGWTALQVRSKFRQARGGVLFIDEAYALQDSQRGSFGDEAINTIVQEMENYRDEVIVIFAGYTEPMQAFLDNNPGMRSRIAFQVEFEDYSTEELCEITKLMVSKRNRKITQEAMDKLAAIYEKARLEPGYGNGRFVRSMLEQAEMNLAQRVLETEKKELSNDSLTTLEARDIPDWKPREAEEKKRIGFVS